MVHKTPLTRLTASIAALCCIATSVFAQTPASTPVTVKGYYTISWNGLPLGRVRTESVEDATSYTLSIDTKSRALASIISPFRTLAVVSGIKNAEKNYWRYIPQTYRAQSDRSDEGDGRRAEITYDEKGAITTRIRTPLDDPTWRPEVPLAQANKATDPITAYAILRQTLRRNVDQKIMRSSVKSYDGRRLAKITVNITARGTEKINGNKTPVLRAKLTRTLLDGYTPKEIAKFKKGDPAVTAIFTDDASVTPLRIDVALMLGTISIIKAKE